MQVSVIVLAAGQGTRMNSDLPKVLHHVAGAPLLVHAMRASASLQPDRTVVVVGHGAEAVAKAARNENPEAQIVIQAEQLGTGHAVRQAAARPRRLRWQGDRPLRRHPLHRARNAGECSPHPAPMSPSSASTPTTRPQRYGRLVMEGDALLRIVEFKDATEAERAITLMQLRRPRLPMQPCWPTSSRA